MTPTYARQHCCCTSAAGLWQCYTNALQRIIVYLTRNLLPPAAAAAASAPDALIHHLTHHHNIAFICKFAYRCARMPSVAYAYIGQARHPGLLPAYHPLPIIALGPRPPARALSSSHHLAFNHLALTPTRRAQMATSHSISRGNDPPPGAWTPRLARRHQGRPRPALPCRPPRAARQQRPRARARPGANTHPARPRARTVAVPGPACRPTDDPALPARPPPSPPWARLVAGAPPAPRPTRPAPAPAPLDLAPPP